MSNFERESNTVILPIPATFSANESRLLAFGTYLLSRTTKKIKGEKR